MLTILFSDLLQQYKTCMSTEVLHKLVKIKKFAISIPKNASLSNMNIVIYPVTRVVLYAEFLHCFHNL